MATLLPDYSRLIKRKRERLGISQNDLAKRIGCDRTCVVRWERGKSVPDAYNRLRLFEVLEIYPDIYEEVS